MVWRRLRRYGMSSVGENPASGSFTSGMSSSSATSEELVAAEDSSTTERLSSAVVAVTSASAWSRLASCSCSDRFTNLPLTRRRRSARLLRQLYLIFLFHTRRERLPLYRAIIAWRSDAV